MNTSIQNILTIAPALISLYDNNTQHTTLQLNKVVNNTDYLIILDTVEFTTNSGVGKTIEELADAIITTLNAGQNAVIFEKDIVTTALVTIASTPADSNIAYLIDISKCPYMEITTKVPPKFGYNLFSLVLEDVKIVVKENRYKDAQERAQRYLAAHILTVLDNIFKTAPIVGGGTAGPITREVVGDVEVWYSDKGGSASAVSNADDELKTTTYGRVFMGIRSRHAIVFV